MHKDALEGEDYAKYNRWENTSESSTALADFQPFIAYVGLIGCLLVVFVFSSALWWNGLSPLLRSQVHTHRLVTKYLLRVHID
jgi:hypothetical protein